MKASDLIKELEKFNQNNDVLVFTESDSLPYKVKRVFNDEKSNGDYSYLIIEEVKE